MRDRVNLIEAVGVVSMVLAVTGVMLNNNRQTECFLFWIVSNSLCCWIHIKMKIWSMAVKDLVFLVLAIAGIYKWSHGI